MTERLRQWRKRWVRTGVFPRGAHVRRIAGRSEKPLSSTKTIVAPRRAAFFLAAATAGAPSAGSPLRLAPEPGWSASAATSRAGASPARRDPRDTARPSPARSRPGSAAASTDPWHSRGRPVPRTAPAPASPAPPPKAAACAPHDLRRAGPRVLPPARLATSAKPSCDSPPADAPHRPASRRLRTCAPPEAGAAPCGDVPEPVDLRN